MAEQSNSPPRTESPDDVKSLSVPTLADRIIVSPAARVRNLDSRNIIHDILRTIPTPGARPVAPAARV